MKRNICNTCHKPKIACICSFITPTANEVTVVILQHPKEVNHAKGTANLLLKSLRNCHVIVGESFNDNQKLQKLLEESQGQTYLLYPSDDAQVIGENVSQSTITNASCLILLDATWRKAYKMFQLSPVIQALPHLKLNDGIVGLYDIRRTSKEGALSTLEACCHALSAIESDSEKYQPLLNSFVQFNHFQLSFRPSQLNHQK